MNQETILRLLSQSSDWLLSSGLRVVLILTAMLVALKLASAVSKRLFGALAARRDDVEFVKRTETLRSVIYYVMFVAISAVATMMVLGEFGIQLGPVLAAAGVVGLAIGFGAQNLVQDVISGFFILLEDQIRVGDVVEIAGKSGLVERVTLRMTILRDLSGNVHYVRNGQIDTVTNMTKGFSRCVLDIGIAYREDVDEVIEVLRTLGEELQADPEHGAKILEPLEILGLDQFGDSAVVIKARFKTRPIEQWSVAREFNRRMKRRFDELGIEIPFPHLTLYAGQDKDGSAPAFPVRDQAPPSPG